MMAERIENFIFNLIEKTEAGEIKWKTVDEVRPWRTIKRQIEKSEEIDLKDYFIDDARSYCASRSRGHVMVLNIRYGNAPVFSPALDKYVLIIKINDEMTPQNLSAYDAEGYKDLLQDLLDAIEFQKNEENIMPDCMYDFFDRFIGEDENGRIIDQ